MRGRVRFNAPVTQQHTLANEVSYSGVGLHSGNRVTMKFKPAAPGTGIRFLRVDLDGTPEIEAKVENVTQTTRSTTLAKGNAKVQTVEHLLAAFAGCEQIYLTEYMTRFSEPNPTCSQAHYLLQGFAEFECMSTLH